MQSEDFTHLLNDIRSDEAVVSFSGVSFEQPVGTHAV